MDTQTKTFDAFASDWWAADGAMAMLHRMHPTRMRFLRDHTDQLLGANLKGLSALDVGCGGGITAESLARMGMKVTGIDGSESLIQTAIQHGQDSGLDIHYHHGLLEKFSTQYPNSFDLICALEVIEHVEDQAAFLRSLAYCLKPGGVLILSTINRTLKSRLLAIGVAEYLLKLLPKGTHCWDQFITPAEICAGLPDCSVQAIAGMLPSPTGKQWYLKPRRLGVNYVMAFQKREINY